MLKLPGPRTFRKLSSKKKFYNEKKFKLIETRSAHKSQGVLFDELAKQLKKYNVKFNPQNEDKILQEFKNQEKYSLLAKLIYNFFQHYRSNSYDDQVVLTKIYDLKVEHEKLRSLSFLKIFSAVYRCYRDDYKKRNRIDFYDMIDNAIDHITNEGLKYILVDEFQDTSRARCRLLEAIKRKNNNCKLFAVGDDWQGISAFAGSDIKIMTQDFKKIFGFSKSITLDKTFRFNQVLCNITNEFILKNKYQLIKKVKSNNQTYNQKVINFHNFNIDLGLNDETPCSNIYTSDATQLFVLWTQRNKMTNPYNGYGCCGHASNRDPYLGETYIAAEGTKIIKIKTRAKKGDPVIITTIDLI